MILASLTQRIINLWLLPLSSALVWLATSPQVTSVFGSVPTAGLLLNLVALPLFSALYPVAFFFSLPLLIGIPGGRSPAFAAEGLFTLWEACADFIAGLVPWSVGWTPALAMIGGGMFVLVLAGGVHPFRGRTVAGAGMILLAGVFIL